MWLHPGATAAEFWSWLLPTTEWYSPVRAWVHSMAPWFSLSYRAMTEPLEEAKHWFHFQIWFLESPFSLPSSRSLSYFLFTHVQPPRVCGCYVGKKAHALTCLPTIHVSAFPTVNLSSLFSSWSGNQLWSLKVFFSFFFRQRSPFLDT